MSTPENMNGDTVGIIGLGLIGGSIAKDLRGLDNPPTIVACDPNEVSISRAMQEGYIQEKMSIRELSRVACTIVIATPIDIVARTALEVRDHVRDLHASRVEKIVDGTKKIVLDTASIKSPVTSVFSVLSSDEVEFIATHPMAGTEFAGFGHARKDLFKAKPWVICPHENNSEDAIRRATSFIDQFGPVVRKMEADTHDRHAAVVSHSVILLSNIIFDFIAERHPEALDLAGDGFSSTTRLASGNPDMHASILRSNKGLIFQYLEEFRQFLGARMNELSTQNNAQDFFEQNASKRNSWLRNKKIL